MTAFLWIVDHPFIAAGALCLVAAALTALLCAFVHFVLDPAAQWTRDAVRALRTPGTGRRRASDPHPDVPAPRPVVVPPMPDRPPAMVRIRLCDPDPHTADTQPIPRVEETAA